MADSKDRVPEELKDPGELKDKDIPKSDEIDETPYWHCYMNNIYNP